VHSTTYKVLDEAERCKVLGTTVGALYYI
jgi:hypothetical protein